MTHLEPNEPPIERRDHREVAMSKVGLPEYLRKETAEGMLPGTIGYFSPNAITYDQATETIWFSTSTEVNDDVLVLSSHTTDKKHRIGIMPILNDEGATDYLLDASGMRPGQIDVEKDWLGFEEERDEGATSDFTIRMRTRHKPIVAAAFTNLDGEIELHGDPAHFDSLRYLVGTYEGIISANRARYETTAADDFDEDDNDDEEVPENDPSYDEETDALFDIQRDDPAFLVGDFNPDDYEPM